MDSMRARCPVCKQGFAHLLFVLALVALLVGLPPLEATGAPAAAPTAYKGWGHDIPIWTGGTVNCFDVDYAHDGMMLVAFQEEGGTMIQVRQSLDRGFHWGEVWLTHAAMPSPPYQRDLGRLKMVLFEPIPGYKDDRYLFFLFAGTDGHLYARFADYDELTTTTAGWTRKVSDATIVEESFDAVYNRTADWPYDHLFVAWLENAGPDQKEIHIARGYVSDGWQLVMTDLYQETFDWTPDEGQKRCASRTRVRRPLWMGVAPRAILLTLS